LISDHSTKTIRLLAAELAQKARNLYFTVISENENSISNLHESGVYITDYVINSIVNFVLCLAQFNHTIASLNQMFHRVSIYDTQTPARELSGASVTQGIAREL
jgi:hypothetical protein